MRRVDSNTVQNLAAVLCGAAIAGMLIASTEVARAILVTPLVLILPGYAAVAALFPRGLGLAERMLLVPMTSIVVIILVGLLLHVTPWGMQPVSWALLLSTVTAAAWLLALKRRGARDDSAPVTRRWKVDFAQGALVASAGLVVGLALGLARMPAPPDDYAGYTMLWLAPQAGADGQGWQLGVESAEFTRADYRLEVRLGAEVVHAWPSIWLAPGERWEADLVLPPEVSAGATMEAYLYRNDAPDEVYRQVAVRELVRPKGNEQRNEYQETADLAGE